MVSTDSFRAGSMKVQVLTTITSASLGSLVSSYPPRRSVPSMTSLSTRFFGQPRLTMPTLITIDPSRVEPVERARIGDGLAQMMDTRDPRDEALETHAEPGVRHRAVLAQIQVPAERLEREVMLLETAQQQVVIVDTLAAADDLAVALGRQDVHAQSAIGVLGIGLHVEGLDARRIVGDHDRALQVFGQDRLVEAAEVVPGHERGRVLLPGALLDL